MQETAHASEALGARSAAIGEMFEHAAAHGSYTVRHLRDGVLLSEETVKNVVCTEGKNAMLANALKGSAFTAVNYMGLISSVTFTAVAATNVAANLNGSTNGWTEAGSTNAPTFAARLAPSFGTAAAGSIPQTTTTNFTMTGAGTVKGAFLLIKSDAGVAPTSAPLNTSGSMWSAGTFTDKIVNANDIIQVTYSTGL